MKFGLAVNANETVSEIIAKCVEAERLDVDYVWVPDTPVQLYAPTVASAVAANTKKIQIGLGLLSVFLHTPAQIAKIVSTLFEGCGERFDLCIGPGDRNLLKSVGIRLYRPEGVIAYVLTAKYQIEKMLRKDGVKCRIWLGAQGPKMLEISKSFDGVLLNYAHPDLIEWAVRKVGIVEKTDFKFGVFSSSYVYDEFDSRIFDHVRVSSAIVALGASKAVLRKTKLLRKIAEAQNKLETGTSVASIIDYIPRRTVDLFSIFKTSTELGKYLLEISKMKIEHVVFGYPQNFSDKTIRELSKALKNYIRVHHG